MEPEIVESQDLQETTEESTTSQEIVETDPAVELETLRAEKADLEAKNKQLFERAKKAEAAKKVEAPQATVTEQSDLSAKDILALTASGISDEEDIDLLQKAARLGGTSIAAAVKDPVVSAILKAKQEERQTALAASTTTTRRASVERTADSLLNAAKQGKMPDSAEETRKLVRASMGLKD